jgi:hypothetical protein
MIDILIIKHTVDVVIYEHAEFVVIYLSILLIFFDL